MTPNVNVSVNVMTPNYVLKFQTTGKKSLVIRQHLIPKTDKQKSTLILNLNSLLRWNNIWLFE